MAPKFKMQTLCLLNPKSPILSGNPLARTALRISPLGVLGLISWLIDRGSGIQFRTPPLGVLGLNSWLIDRGSGTQFRTPPLRVLEVHSEHHR